MAEAVGEFPEAAVLAGCNGDLEVVGPIGEGDDFLIAAVEQFAKPVRITGDDFRSLRHVEVHRPPRVQVGGVRCSGGDHGTRSARPSERCAGGAISQDQAMQARLFRSQRNGVFLLIEEQAHLCNNARFSDALQLDARGLLVEVNWTLAITHTYHPGENNRYRLMHNAKSVSNADCVRQVQPCCRLNSDSPSFVQIILGNQPQGASPGLFSLNRG